MPPIKFSHYYKKLYPDTHIFMTLRSYNEEKWEYYKNLVGTELDVEVKDNDLFKGLYPIDYILLIFRTSEWSVEEEGTMPVANKGRLLQILKVHYDDLSEFFKGFDTEVKE